MSECRLALKQCASCTERITRSRRYCQTCQKLRTVANRANVYTAHKMERARLRQIARKP